MKNSFFLRAFLPAVVSLTATSSHAATYNYLGGGTFSAPQTNNFSTGFSPALPGGGPTTADLLTFNGSIANTYIATNDFATPVNVNAIRFGNAAEVSATVAGVEGALINLGGTSPYINFNGAGHATLSANTAFTTSGFIVKSQSINGVNNPEISGNIAFGAGTSTVIAVADSGGDGYPELALSGVLSGAGSVTLQNNATGLPSGIGTRANQADWGTILISGDNSGLSGAVNILYGRAVINNANSLGTGTVTIGGGVGVTGGTLSLGGNNAGGTTQAYGAIDGPGITINNALNLGGATAGNYGIGLQNNGGANTFTNTVTLTQTAVNIAVNNRSSLTFAGTVSEANAGTVLTKSGNGALYFQGTTNFTGGLNINGGNVELAAGATTGTISIGNGGALNLAGKYLTVASALNDVTPTSTGSLALTTDSSENVNFTGHEGLALGAAGNVTYTGTMTPVVDPAIGVTPVYHLGGGGGTLNIPGTNALTGDSVVVIGSAGATGTVALSGTNDYSGGTLIRGGALSVTSESSLGSGDVTFNGGTLAIHGTSPVALTKNLNFAGAGTIEQSNTAGVDFSGMISGTGTFTKSGEGDLTLLAASSTTGAVVVKTGKVVLQDAFVTATNYMTVAHTETDTGRMDIRGGSIVTVNGDLNVGDLGANGVINVSDDALLQVNTLYLARSFAGSGVINQTGGTVKRGNGGGDWRIGGWASTADAPAVGIYNISGGELAVGDANFQIGAWGSGMIRQTGGSVTSSSWTAVGRYAGGFGVLDVSGGTFAQTSAERRLFAGEAGYGVITARGNGVVRSNGGITIAWDGIQSGGQVNVNAGGRVETSFISTGTNGQVGQVNFNGGTLASTAASTDFIKGNLVANVFEHGARIDTTHGDVTIFQDLVAPEGNGLTSISFTEGSGFKTAPIVRITGGGGTGASAVAEVDANGNLTGFTITSHGTGYTSAPTITLFTANGGTVTGVSGQIGANVSGSLTKVGAGTLTLWGANTYAGGTFVEQGTLVVGDGALLGPGWVFVNGGVLDFDYDFTLTTGGLILNDGQLKLDQNLTFEFLTIDGTTLLEGVYSYEQLKATYANFFADAGSGQITVLTSVPEPGVVALFALGGGAMLLMRRRRR